MSLQFTERQEKRIRDQSLQQLEVDILVYAIPRLSWRIGL